MPSIQKLFLLISKEVFMYLKIYKGVEIMSDSKKRRYIGGGIGVGAALGILFGTLLGGDIVFGVVIGAVVGLIVGAIWDNMSNRN